MKQRSNVDNTFILVSDGEAEYPASVVEEIKDFRQIQKDRNLNVEYVSILIDSSHAPVMLRL
jgi:hypothetical protein